ncbi:hypothetical protein GT347_01660 [Xylophilus rhododendri]|uniref:Uncharacterized protein n=1 Tax=Xylophilus rhododendri TaxID=2697032 RepID=A0A857J0U9_9BURK|nr:hypothetical protein [Xylophilus rhododendri]QHI96809.1 hypothetical protein GT347_01660 [Xylophilus rhododendri]
MDLPVPNARRPGGACPPTMDATRPRPAAPRSRSGVHPAGCLLEGLPLRQQLSAEPGSWCDYFMIRLFGFSTDAETLNDATRIFGELHHIMRTLPRHCAHRSLQLELDAMRGSADELFGTRYTLPKPGRSRDVWVVAMARLLNELRSLQGRLDRLDEAIGTRRRAARMNAAPALPAASCQQTVRSASAEDSATAAGPIGIEPAVLSAQQDQRLQLALRLARRSADEAGRIPDRQARQLASAIETLFEDESPAPPAERARDLNRSGTVVSAVEQGLASARLDEAQRGAVRARLAAWVKKTA